MEKLSMCRVCLGKDVGLNCIIGTHLQEMYESLVLMPFETEDTRPVLVCYICRARLQNCYELRRNCLRSEELFIELKCDELALVKHNDDYKNRLTQMNNVVYLSTGGVPQSNADNVDVDTLTLDEVKHEQNNAEDIIEDALVENSVYDNSDAADSDDDRLIMVMEEQPGDETSEVSPMYPEQAVPTSSNLKQHQLVQDKFKELNKVTAADKTTATSTNEVTFTLNDNKHITATLATNKPYHCDICNKEFTLKGSFNSHMRRHTAEKPYSCDLCDKQYFDKNSLYRHMQRHTGERPHCCDLCNKRFMQHRHLLSHYRTHTGEKPYRCDKCNRQFPVKSALKYHINVHCEDKPNRCSLCSSEYTRPIDLVKHMRKHTGEKPYSCDVCDAKFTEKRYLTKHMRKHTGEKPHRCEICNKQYSIKCDLKSHMRTHTGEKPYRCDLCHKQFPHRQSLNYHKRLVVCVPLPVVDKR